MARPAWRSQQGRSRDAGGFERARFHWVGFSRRAVMAAPTCAFPLFRDRFWPREPLQDGNAPPGAAASARPGAQPGCQEPQLSPTKAASRMGNLRVLDLRALPRDDGPPTELRARKEKLAHFERQCSRVAEGLYVGAEHVARSRDALREAGITHVVNCVGFLYPPYFEGELQYQTLYLQDTPGEDILCVLYDVFDFIEAAMEGSTGGSGGSSDSCSGGSCRVLIHCSQGVSRSATLAIAYLMWKQGAGYDEVFQAVKAARGVTNPNIGFICQLLQWHKRRHAAPADGCRLYRIAPQSAAAAQYLVPKTVGSARGAASLDPRGAFVLHSPTAVHVWEGASCPEPFVAAAQRFAVQLQKYEAVQGPVALVQQGQEPDEFWSHLAAASAAGGGEGSRNGSPAAPGGVAVASATELLAAAAAAAAGGPPLVMENSSYDKDFELYSRSLTSRTSGDSGGDSARSGNGGSGARKTPREEEGGSTATSPNDRLRKQARGEERPPSPGKRRREPHGDLRLGGSDLQRRASMDSGASQQLGKKERTVEEAGSPPCLSRAASEQHLAAVAASTPHDGSMTPRGGRVADVHPQQQRQQQQQHKGWQRQPSNLGRPAAAGGADAAARGSVEAAPVAAAAAPDSSSNGGQRVAVPPINLRLALHSRQ